MSSTAKRRKKPKQKTVIRLWATAAGRCQLEGCNEQLYIVPRTQTYMNRAYVAHIYGAEATGPRPNLNLSPEELRHFDNLILLCDACHRMIDRDKVDAYPAKRLFAAKRQHMADVKRLTEYASAPKTQLLLYGSRIGHHDAPLNFRDTSVAVLGTHQPKDNSAIEINVKGFSSVEDHQPNYWAMLDAHLESEFTKKIESLHATGSHDHLSVFPLAPQPLLIKLGVLMGGLKNVSCYQLSKEPQTWKWRQADQSVHHSITQTKKGQGAVVLKLSLSADITDDRIPAQLGLDCSVWTLTHPNPHNDYLQSPADLEDYRRVIRRAFSLIKRTHGENEIIHMLPAAPVSTSFETGRAWNHKADLPLKIYDQNHQGARFIEAITIDNTRSLSPDLN